MGRKLKQGGSAPTFRLKTIHGIDVQVPDAKGLVVHLQFRRFAGCPVCNLHLQPFRQRHSEIESAGIKEIVVFHSDAADLLPYQGQFPFAVIGDPEKDLYRQYGVETSIWAILNPSALPASIKGNLAKDKPSLGAFPKGGILGLPADFLITPDGTISALHYGKHVYDQWEVDEVLSHRERL